MSLQPGMRVRILQPFWNHAIWGFAGTIGASTRYTDRWQVFLDHPNPNNTGASTLVQRNEVFAAPDEIEPLTEGKTSHTGWSPA